MTRNLDLDFAPGGPALLTFDRPGASANLFDSATLDELSRALNAVESAAPPGLILFSAKPRFFFAGADVREFFPPRDADAARALARRGQDLFNRIAALPCPTVAAIHGQALGGGCEMALACDAIVLSDAPETRIGLPEIRLGILPAWGGSFRLPRRVGLRRALEIILAGKAVSALHALRIGLADRVVPHQDLPRAARACVAQPPRRRRVHWDLWPVVRQAIAGAARKHLLRKTRGLAPAPERALAVVMAAVRAPPEQALALEREALADLMSTPECANLVRLFLAGERLKKSGAPGTEAEAAPVSAREAAARVAGAAARRVLTSARREIALLLGEGVPAGAVCRALLDFGFARDFPGALPEGPAPGRNRMDASRIADRVVLRMINESARCLEEGLAGCAEDLDFALVAEDAFPAVRGGPLRYADTLGPGRVVEALGRLAGADPSFAPAPLLIAAACEGRPLTP